MIGNGRIPAQLSDVGGVLTAMINKTGAPSVKGTVLEPSDTTDKAVKLTDIDDLDPFAIMYSDGIADGEQVLVVVAGIAEVLFSTPVTRATFARVPVAADASATVGLAIAEPLPSPPLATDKHFREIGHPIESIGAPGLALTVIHFN